MSRFLPVIVFGLLFVVGLSMQFFFGTFESKIPSSNTVSAPNKASVSNSVPASNSRVNLRGHFNILFNESSFRDIYGNEIVLREIRSRTVIINFWASWCGPCISEIRELRKLYSTYSGDELEIISINVDTRKGIREIKQLKRNLGINYAVIADTDGKISDEFLANKLPYNLIFKDGKMVDVIIGISRSKKNRLIKLIRN